MPTVGLLRCSEVVIRQRNWMRASSKHPVRLTGVCGVVYWMTERRVPPRKMTRRSGEERIAAMDSGILRGTMIDGKCGKDTRKGLGVCGSARDQWRRTNTNI